VGERIVLPHDSPPYRRLDRREDGAPGFVDELDLATRQYLSSDLLSKGIPIARSAMG